MPTIEDIQKALSAVQEPESHQGIMALQMVKKIQIDGDEVTLVIELPKPEYNLKDSLEADIKSALRSPSIKEVNVLYTARPPMDRTTVPPPLQLPGVKNVIAVYACKGGVGKTTVSTNLSVALAKNGFKVGLLDADIHGPNIPLMMGVDARPPVLDGNKIMPIVAHGVKVMSLGLLADANVPMIWRGPMVHGAVQQLLRDTQWGELDFLIVDLPPGTGDAQLTIVQSVPLAGVVIVTTPQTVSLLDGVKGIKMFLKMEIPILGIIENMSGFVCPHCGTTTDIFSKGGGEDQAKKWSLPFLGSLPIDPAVVTGGDTGQPIVLSHPQSLSATAFLKMVNGLTKSISKKP